jgi:hypothetical protein
VFSFICIHLHVYAFLYLQALYRKNRVVEVCQRCQGQYALNEDGLRIYLLALMKTSKIESGSFQEMFNPHILNALVIAAGPEVSKSGGVADAAGATGAGAVGAGAVGAGGTGASSGIGTTAAGGVQYVQVVNPNLKVKIAFDWTSFLIRGALFLGLIVGFIYITRQSSGDVMSGGGGKRM